MNKRKRFLRGERCIFSPPHIHSGAAKWTPFNKAHFGFSTLNQALVLAARLRSRLQIECGAFPQRRRLEEGCFFLLLLSFIHLPELSVIHSAQRHNIYCDGIHRYQEYVMKKNHMIGTSGLYGEQLTQR